MLLFYALLLKFIVILICVSKVNVQVDYDHFAHKHSNWLHNTITSHTCTRRKAIGSVASNNLWMFTPIKVSHQHSPLQRSCMGCSCCVLIG